MGRIIVLILLVVTLSGTAHAAASDPWQRDISEAAGRFGIPETWIRAVIAAESGGHTKAVSPKGAMGLMQLMPETWEDMRSSHDLGDDPFDSHANILAGTAYLKAMYDRFGYPALFAAYNAGPTRYEEHLHTGKPLPDETLAYIADLGKALSFGPQTPQQIATGMRLFFSLSAAESGARSGEKPAHPNDLFVQLATKKVRGK